MIFSGFLFYLFQCLFLHWFVKTFCFFLLAEEEQQEGASNCETPFAVQSKWCEWVGGEDLSCPDHIFFSSAYQL